MTENNSVDAPEGKPAEDVVVEPAEVVEPEPVQISLVAWWDHYEEDSAAEAAYIEHETQVRGDAMWRPWNLLEEVQREHWRKIVNAVFKDINRGRMNRAQA